MRFVLAVFASVVVFVVSLVGGGATFSQPDVTYLGAERMPARNVDTTFAGGGLAGRKVGGKLHLFVYGNNAREKYAGILTVTSSTVLVLGGPAGGADFTIGNKVAVTTGMPTPGVGVYPQVRTITNISGDTITLDTALSPLPAARTDVLYHDGDDVYELIDSEASTCHTGNYNTTYSSAPRMCLYKNWGQIYNGHRVSWSGSTMETPANGYIPDSLAWDDHQQLLFWGFHQQYTTPNRQTFGMSSLDDVSTGASTGYGAFTTTGADDDRYNSDDGRRVGSAPLLKQSDGSMLLSGITYQLAHSPAGPWLRVPTGCATCVNGWPSTSTPAGRGSAALDFSTRALYYYQMLEGDPSGNYWNHDGSLHGTFRSFPSTYHPLMFEPNYESPRIDGDPAQNSGKWGWTEFDNNGGCAWLELAHKSGIVCMVSRVGSPDASGDCTLSAHHWYETCAPQSPGCTPSQDRTNHINCSHGCSPSIVVTGPQTNLMYPGMMIYAVADANAVIGGSKVDYTMNPVTAIDLADIYGVHTAPSTVNGGNYNIKMGYFDRDTNNLYVVSTLADDSVGGIRTSLVHVFHFADTPAPQPLLPAASGFAALVALSGVALRRRPQIALVRTS